MVPEVSILCHEGVISGGAACRVVCPLDFTTLRVNIHKVIVNSVSIDVIRVAIRVSIRGVTRIEDAELHKVGKSTMNKRNVIGQRAD